MTRALVRLAAFTMSTRRGPWLIALVALLLTGCTSWGILTMQGEYK